MTAKPAWVQEVETRTRGLPVLLVEGPSDVRLFEHFFDRHAPGWRARFVILGAGSKEHVRSGVAVHHPEWRGIIDTDEWSPADVQAAVGDGGRLRALPRFCIESYTCDPDELWPLIPELRREAVATVEVLRQPIVDNLPAWVAHGALWRVLRRLYPFRQFPHQLEAQPITNEGEIRRILTDWHNQLAPEAVLAQYHLELEQARTLSPVEQLHCYVHGKMFYHQVVVQVLDHLFAGKGADDWVGRFLNANLPPPEDLVELLDWVISEFSPAAA